jgi:uncharacterized protein YjdB
VKKYLMVIYLAVMCLCMGVSVSAAQYSFAYSSAAVKTGTTSEIYIYKGKSKQDPKTFKWSTSDAKTISVTNGKITAKKAGIYNEGLERIYCEYCGTVKEERVIPKLTREVYISDTALSLTAGRHKTIRILYATHDVTWKSSNKSVATMARQIGP